MSDNIDQLLGEISGKLDRLTDNFDRYLSAHNQRHEKIDEELKEHAEDINQAKGAKSAIFAGAAIIAGVVGYAADSIGKIFR